MIYSGKFKVPKEGHFGWRMLNGKPDDHKGIDVVGITDKHVCAVVGGRVVTSKIVTDKSNRTWEWGNFVCILGDDGRMYYYCHLSKRLVSVGRRVEAGQHIGIEGNTGYSFGSHCHFEVRENGVSIDPAPFLGIPNKAGTYGTDWRAEVQKKFGLSKDTMAYLDKYRYAADLYRKLGQV
ncbi:MAG: M23 family metallopeptidase [Clostridia bacterium]|nr:M23 family metallopeptidase [Clostridia bacterium]